MSMISELVKELRWIAEHEYQSRNSEDTIRRAAETIEMLSEKARGQEWISCSERVPETKSVDDWTKALVCSADGGIAVGSFNSEYGWTFSHWFGEPIAWMPVPEPWKGADDESLL